MDGTDYPLTPPPLVRQSGLTQKQLEEMYKPNKRKAPPSPVKQVKKQRSTFKPKLHIKDMNPHN